MINIIIILFISSIYGIILEVYSHSFIYFERYLLYLRNKLISVHNLNLIFLRNSSSRLFISERETPVTLE